MIKKMTLWKIFNFIAFVYFTYIMYTVFQKNVIYIVFLQYFCILMEWHCMLF